MRMNGRLGPQSHVRLLRRVSNPFRSIQDQVAGTAARRDLTISAPILFAARKLAC
jgi:hypothetical protein